MPSTVEQLIEQIRENVIGQNRAPRGPFGPRRILYADYTASGRSLKFIESFIQNEVLPLYANTHTESSVTGLQTTRFREDARKIIHETCGGGKEDVVIFSGSGATGAINKLVEILNLRIPADLDAKYDLQDQIPSKERPVVFIGPYEHHSNELPWRETIADVITIDEDENGQIDQKKLAEALKKYADRPLKIGSFSAASNVTGIVSDMPGISSLLHRHQAYAFWDYAAAAPYVKINMNPSSDGDAQAYADAIFISPHKFIGGPGTPGVLMVKKHLLQNRVPSVPGGGTVSYVNPVGHDYLRDPVLREEGGTPEIVGAIRAGLVFGLKKAVGEKVIESLERTRIERAISEWSKEPNIEILGNTKAKRLSIVSFVIRHGEKKFLHHNFVVALLNDLFGIQARGGCSCAGPYGHRLLGIDLPESMRYHDAVNHGCEGIKPGWIRVNFNYFISESTEDYILEAVKLIAARGWTLLPEYEFCPETGLWSHKNHEWTGGMSLKDLRYESGQLSYANPHINEAESAYGNYLKAAKDIFSRAEEKFPKNFQGKSNLPEDAEILRWFPLMS